MDFEQNNICNFFGAAKITYKIPTYQRAYSWEEQQLKTFLEDLSEHKNAGQNNPYCYGNVLLETISSGKQYEIIDGQQRLTTISIFMRVLLNVLKERANTGEALYTSENEEIKTDDEEKIYFANNGVIKLRPTPSDQSCYDTLIIENKPSFHCLTPSQERMQYAKNYFEQKLAELETQELIRIFETVQNAKIYSIKLTGKKEAALMFELQNNRGKDLTNLEKLKSFLMYQTYVYSDPASTDTNIEYIANQFDPIYTIVNKMSLQLGDTDDDSRINTIHEDNILLYHSYAYNKKNFGYRNLNDTFEEYKAVPTEDKIAWIKNYANELYSSFASVQEVLEIKNNAHFEKIKKMSIPFFVFPFLIKGAKNKETLPQLFELFEVLCFRYKLINSRADIRGRLNALIRSFSGDVKQLAADMEQTMTEAYYWGDKKFLEILNGDMCSNKMLNYFLWEYEQSLQPKGYAVSMTNESIEHISPQTENEDGSMSGYEIGEDGRYTKEFRENYINKLGNLMLLSQSQNSSIGNKPLKVKLEIYQNNPLLQSKQIKEFIENGEDPVWDSKTIDQRHAKMIEFALKRWSYIK